MIEKDKYMLPLKLKQAPFLHLKFWTLKATNTIQSNSSNISIGTNNKNGSGTNHGVIHSDWKVL